MSEVWLVSEAEEEIRRSSTVDRPLQTAKLQDAGNLASRLVLDEDSDSCSDDVWGETESSQNDNASIHAESQPLEPLPGGTNGGAAWDSQESVKNTSSRVTAPQGGSFGLDYFDDDTDAAYIADEPAISPELDVGSANDGSDSDGDGPRGALLSAAVQGQSESKMNPPAGFSDDDDDASSLSTAPPDDSSSASSLPSQEPDAHATPQAAARADRGDGADSDDSLSSCDDMPAEWETSLMTLRGGSSPLPRAGLPARGTPTPPPPRKARVAKPQPQPRAAARKRGREASPSDRKTKRARAAAAAAGLGVGVAVAQPLPPFTPGHAPGIGIAQPVKPRVYKFAKGKGTPGTPQPSPAGSPAVITPQCCYVVLSPEICGTSIEGAIRATMSNYVLTCADSECGAPMVRWLWGAAGGKLRCSGFCVVLMPAKYAIREMQDNGVDGLLTLVEDWFANVPCNSKKSLILIGVEPALAKWRTKMQKKGRKGKPIILKQVNKALVEVYTQLGIEYHTPATNEEAVSFVASMTATITAMPRVAVPDMWFESKVKADRLKERTYRHPTGRKLAETWCKQLQMVPGLSGAKAARVCEHFPTAARLIDQYANLAIPEAQRRGLLTHSFSSRNELRLSTKVYQLFTSRNPDGKF